MNSLSTSFRIFTLTAVISALACGGDKAATDESGTSATSGSFAAIEAGLDDKVRERARKVAAVVVAKM